MKNKTQFHRVKKERNFTMIDNDIIRRKDLSWKAKGIMIYVFSLPDDWNVNLNEIMRHATDGEASFRSGWKELTDLGYVERKPVRDKESKKITHWKTYIYENVDLKASEPYSENLHVGNQDVGNQDVGNRKLLRTKRTKDLKELSTKRTKEIMVEKKELDEIPYKEIVDYLNEKADRNFRHSTNSTQRHIKARWNEGFDLDDFKRVIKVKVDEWKKDKAMNQYLRPQTLFGANFEGYLNQPTNDADMKEDWNEWKF